VDAQWVEGSHHQDGHSFVRSERVGGEHVQRESVGDQYARIVRAWDVRCGLVRLG
jgi:hypothetical protein